jgi:hypothetical protein
MSIDSLGRSAGAALREAVTEADTSAAFAQALRPPPRRHQFVVAAACTAVVLLLLWVVSGALSTTRASDPVAPAQGTGAEVGAGLRIPLTFEVPEGYTVTHDGGFVSLMGAGGTSGRAIYVGTPTTVFDPRDQRAMAPQESLLPWILSNPYLDNDRWSGVEADGWLGSTMELVPRDGVTYRCGDPAPCGHELFLFALGDATARQTVGYSTSDGTFSWTVLAVGDDELLIVVVSPQDADQQARTALTDLLGSLDFEQEAIVR